MNVSECALFVDVVLLCIGTILNHVSDVFNEVVLDNVVRKIKGDTNFFSFIITFRIFFFCRLRPVTKSYLCSKISVKNDSLLFSPKEDDSKETDNCRE